MDPQAFQHALGLHQRGQLAQAEQLYREILASEPRHFAAAHSLGLIFLQRGQADLAERQLSRALELDPTIAEAHGNRGNALKALHRRDEALDSYDRALALKPDFAEVLVNRGSILQDLGRFDQALDSYDRALALRPQSPVALGNRAWVLHKLDRPDEALAGYDRLLALRPDDHHALVNRGLVLHDLRRFEEAVANYDTALALQADAPRVFFSRANALAELLRNDEALASLDQAIALQPDFADARRNRGILRLLTGNFAEGWVDYEHRRPKEQARRMLPLLAAPTWAGESLEGRSILVSDATGMGDAIQFVRYLPLLAARGARVSFLGNARLYRLFGSLAPGARFIAELQSGDRFDFQCKLLSLPHLFQTRLATIPGGLPYLRAEPALSEKWRDRLGGEGFKIGICWKGNPSRSIDAGRSIPLAGFQRIAQLPGVRLISLQKRFGLDELEGLPAPMRVETLGADFDEGSDAFVDSAAVMAHLDLVISSDTSLAHLAGALGRPAWVALKRAPEWRWLLDRDDSPWYPSLRLFRQSRRDQWPDVFDAMALALAKQVPSP